MSIVKLVIPENPTAQLEGNYSMKVLKRIEDNWRSWCYRKWNDNKEEFGDVVFDEDFPMDKKEWRRAKRLYDDNHEGLKLPRHYNWEDNSRVEIMASMMQDEHVKQKREEDKERSEREKWIQEKIKEEKERKKTYAEAVKGRKDLWPIARFQSPEMGGTFVLMLTLVSIFSPGECAPLEKWTNTGESLVKACNGIVFYRAVDDTSFGYTNRMWERCCREAEKEVNPPAVGTCEIRNSNNKANIDKKLFDLFYNDELRVSGRHCIELVRLCRDMERTGVWGIDPNEPKKLVTENVKGEDKESKKESEEEKRQEAVPKQDTQSTTPKIKTDKDDPIDVPYDPETPSFNRDSCSGQPLESVDLRTILNMEFCLGYCEVKGKPRVTIDQRWVTGFKRSECWEETLEEWQLEDDQSVWSKLDENPKIAHGGRALRKCHFRDCLADEKPASRFEVWVSEGKRLNLSICENCKTRNFPKECLVTVRGSNTDVVIDMLADVGIFYIKVGKDHREGSFIGQKSITMEINGPGSQTITGYCNDRIVERKFAVTTNEYCNEKYKGIFEKLELIYCKQHKLVKTLFLTIIVLTILYYGSEVMGAFIGALTSIIFLMFTVFVTKKIICSICSKTTLFGIGHKCCPKDCIYCGCCILTEQSISEMTPDEIKTYIYDHQRKRCTKFVSSNLFVISLMNYFRLFCRFFTYLFKKAPAIMICILLIWLASIIFQEADAFKLSEIAKNSTKGKNMKRDKMVKNQNSQNNPQTDLSNVDTCLLKNMFFNLIIPVFALILLLSRRAISKMYLVTMGNLGYIPCNFCYQMKPKGNIDMAHDCKKLFCQSCKSLWGTSGYFDKEENVRSITSEHDCFVGSRERKSIRIYSDKLKKFTLKLINLPSMFVFMITLTLTLRCATADHYSEMKKMENDLGDMIQELKREGFHPYSARFSGGLRENIAAVREVKECKSGTCRINMEIETTLKVKEGREYGFSIKNKNKYNNIKDLGEAHLNVKLSNLKSICEYKVLYKTGPAKHKQYSGDTCTENCGKCQQYLKENSNEKEDGAADVYEVNHENTASWGCDGPGCIAINQGCTCGRCYCTLDDESVEVMELVKEKQIFDLCIQLGGNGYCKTMEKETREKKIFVINFEENLSRCPNMIAREKNGKILEGEMNKAGEFDNKFGSIQKIGDSIATKREERYQEHCLFAKHRYITFDQCCKDTFHMMNYLKKSSLKPSSSLRFEKQENEIGTWKINLLVPPLSYTEKEDSLKIENLKIEDCLGCHNCEEGGSCLLQYKSSHEATVSIECTPCTLDTTVIHLFKGIKSTPFNLFCKGEEITLQCKVYKKDVKANFRLLKQPNKPHGDGYINMDREKFIHEECEGFLCGLKLPNLNFFGWIKWVLIILIGTVVVLGVVYVIKILYKFFSKVKNY